MKHVCKATKADIGVFCDRTGRFPALAAPWADGGYSYATDGCIVLRIKAKADAPAANHPMTGAVDKMFADHPALEAGKLQPLPACAAKAKALVTCRDCHGAGAALNEKGKPIYCPCCLGEKTLPNTRGIPIGAQAFAAHYLARLVRLPDMRIVTPTGRSIRPLRIAFSGGEGLLMPVGKQPDSSSI